jgi:hypothetical protein
MNKIFGFKKMQLSSTYFALERFRSNLNVSYYQKTVVDLEIKNIFEPISKFCHILYNI